MIEVVQVVEGGTPDSGDSIVSGVLVTIVAAAGCNVGKVLQKKGTGSLPQLSLERHVLLCYLRNPLWMAGFLSDIGGALLTLFALSMAPVSVVQPVTGSGMAMLALFSHFYLREKLSAHEWVGVAVAITGSVGIGLTSTPGDNQLLPLPAALLGIALVVAMICMEITLHWHPKGILRELVPGCQAGVCFGSSAACSRAGMLLSSQLDSPLWTPLGILFSVGLTSTGFVCQTKAIKDGRAVVVCTYGAIAAIITGVVIGLVALNETLPKDFQPCCIWLCSMCMIFIGIALLMHKVSRSHMAPAEKQIV